VRKWKDFRLGCEITITAQVPSTRDHIYNKISECETTHSICQWNVKARPTWQMERAFWFACPKCYDIIRGDTIHDLKFTEIDHMHSSRGPLVLIITESSQKTPNSSNTWSCTRWSNGLDVRPMLFPQGHGLSKLWLRDLTIFGSSKFLVTLPVLAGK